MEDTEKKGKEKKEREKMRDVMSDVMKKENKDRGREVSVNECKKKLDLENLMNLICEDFK